MKKSLSEIYTCNRENLICSIKRKQFKLFTTKIASELKLAEISSRTYILYINLFFSIWQRWTSIYAVSLAKNQIQGLPHTRRGEFDYFRVISRRSRIAAGLLELGKIAEGVVRIQRVLRRCEKRMGRKQIRQSRKSALQDATMVLAVEALILIFVRLSISAYLCPLSSFFYAVDPLDLSRWKEESSARARACAFSSLSLNTPTPGGIQFYSADCFLLYRRLLR